MLHERATAPLRVTNNLSCIDIGSCASIARIQCYACTINLAVRIPDLEAEWTIEGNPASRWVLKHCNLQFATACIEHSYAAFRGTDSTVARRYLHARDTVEQRQCTTESKVSSLQFARLVGLLANSQWQDLALIGQICESAVILRVLVVFLSLAVGTRVQHFYIRCWNLELVYMLNFHRACLSSVG